MYFLVSGALCPESYNNCWAVNHRRGQEQANTSRSGGIRFLDLMEDNDVPLSIIPCVTVYKRWIEPALYRSNDPRE